MKINGIKQFDIINARNHVRRRKGKIAFAVHEGIGGIEVLHDHLS